MVQIELQSGIKTQAQGFPDARTKAKVIETKVWVKGKDETNKKTIHHRNLPTRNRLKSYYLACL